MIVISFNSFIPHILPPFASFIHLQARSFSARTAFALGLLTESFFICFCRGTDGRQSIVGSIVRASLFKIQNSKKRVGRSAVCLPHHTVFSLMLLFLSMYLYSKNQRGISMHYRTDRFLIYFY